MISSPLAPVLPPSSRCFVPSSEHVDALPLAPTPRELQLSVAEEDYQRAAQLRDAVAALAEALPTTKQLLLRLADTLQQPGASVEARRAAAQQLGELGDAQAVPHLATALADPRVADWAEGALWALFMKAPTQETQALMESGCRMMQVGAGGCKQHACIPDSSSQHLTAVVLTATPALPPPQRPAATQHPQQWAPALQAFTDIIRQAPSFAEARAALAVACLHRLQAPG